MKKKLLKIIGVIIISLFVLAVLFLLSGASLSEMQDIVERMARGSVKAAELNTGLPIIQINTKGGVPVTSREKYLDATITITDPDKFNNPTDGGATAIEIRGRGNSTWKQPKKPYRIRYPEKVSLFGLEKAKNWVLLANYLDPTLIMNTIALELGNRFGLPFTNHYVHVELILNGVYEGSYLLTEHVQVGKGRVDIDEKTGFFVEADGHFDEDPKFLTNIIKMPVMIKSPADLPDDSAYDFVRNRLNEFEAALFSESFPDNNYRDLVELDTVIDFIMINEIVRNVELQLPNSVYMYRDGKKDSKIGFGPLWDFDYGFSFDGKRNYFGKEDYFIHTTGMYYQLVPIDEGSIRVSFSNGVYRNGPGRDFFAQFFEDPYFRNRYKGRWNEKYADIADMENFMDKMETLLEKSHEANFKVWWWHKLDYKNEIEKMKVWWKKRIEYLNKEINGYF